MKFRAFFLFFLALSVSVFGAIKISSIKQKFNDDFSAETLFPSSARGVIALTNNWSVFPEEHPEKKAVLDIPVLVEGNASLVLQNEFTLTQKQIDENEIQIEFGGLDYFAEISINDQSTFKRPYGGIPFSFHVPKEILLADEPNKITVKINTALNSYSTIPPVQRFLFPEHRGGILGSVKVRLIPSNRILSADFNYELFSKKKKKFAKIKFDIKTATEAPGNFTAKVTLYDNNLNAIAETKAKSNSLSPEFSAEVTIEKPLLWSPENPRIYYAKISLSAADSVLDEYSEIVPLFTIAKNERGLFMNGKPFSLRGVTYVPFSKANNPDFSYEQVKNDLDLAKSLGFNFIRFANQIPDENIIYLAAKAGFLISVEMPVNFLPDALFDDDVFQKVISDYSREFVNNYSKYFNVLLLGAGNSFLPNSAYQIKYVNYFADLVKNKSGKFSFASFLALPEQNVATDFTNIEFYSEFNSAELQKLNGSQNIFITGTYPAFAGSKSGSLVRNSYEAQGAFYKKILKFYKKRKLAGVFINSLTDYSGDFNSLYASYSENRLYKIGIVGTDRKAKRIGYNVVRESLQNGKNVMIPLGAKKAGFPLLFVVVPLFLAAMIAFVINSRRKFREDTLRALLRSYNFFSDIRDLRLLSGFHSYFMFVVNSATFALLVVNILYFLRSNIVLDKIVVAFGSASFSDFVSFLAWKPVNAFFVLFGIFVGLTVLITLVLKFFSVFNPTRVLFSSIFYTVVWAFMPVNLLIPLELLLLKMLGLNVANFWIYLFLFLFVIWLVLRLFKGVYVVFDIRPSTVYLFGLGTLFVIFGGLLIYVQTSANALDYIAAAIAQIGYL